MVSFLSEEICEILQWLIGFLIQKEVLKAADTSYKPSKLQVLDQKNWRKKSDVKLTTSGAKALKKIPNYLHQGLKGSWACFLKGMIGKIQERSLTSCKLVRVSAALDSVKIDLLESENEQSLFDKINDIMYSKKRISAKQGGSAKDGLITFFKMLLNVTRLNLPILVKILCLLMNFLVYTRIIKCTQIFGMSENLCSL